MKLSLTIEGDASALANVLALLGAGAAIVPTASGLTVNAPGALAPQPVSTSDDEDDDSGPVNTAAPAVDASGLPWDERIHAGTKATNEKGFWKKRRGGPKGDQLAAIEAELRARNAAPVMAQPQPAPMMQPVAQPMAQPQPAPMMQPVAAPVMQQPQPIVLPQSYEQPAPVMQQPQPVAQPQPMPMAQPQPVAQPQPTGELDGSAFMQHLTLKMNERDANGAPLIHAEYLNRLKDEVAAGFSTQLGAITDIMGNPQMISYAVQLLQRDGRW